MPFLIGRNRIAQLTDFFISHGVPDPAAARHQAIIAVAFTRKIKAGGAGAH